MMHPLLLCRDCCARAVSRKKTLICFALLFFAFMICGMLFIKTPAVYDYHLTVCDRFIDRVCFSTRSVFLIFLERAAGNALILLLLSVAGIHIAGLVVTPAVICFRAYTFGGTLAIFFSVYRFTGAIIVFALYLPVHVLLDAVFLLAVSLAFSRAFCFRFCADDWKELLCDFFVLLAFVVAVCLLEAVLLLVLFHPLGNIL